MPIEGVSSRLVLKTISESKFDMQFVLKIGKLSHIMGPTSILEMARAYGLRHRLWLLCIYNKHARAQNKARSFVNETVKMEP